MIFAGAAPSATAANPAKGEFLAALSQGKGKWNFDKAELKQARAEAREQRKAGKESAKSAKRRSEFLKETAQRHLAYASDSIDVVPLLDGDVQVAIPEGITVDTLTLEIANGEVEIQSRASSDASEAAVFSGPGMADWSYNGSGQYNVYVTSIGSSQFLWKRDKLSSDGSSTYDFYQYSRKAVGHPYPKSGAIDPRVKLLRVQSYPYDSIESGLVNWQDYEPAVSFTGNCDSSPFTASVSAPLFGLGYSFIDCDDYLVWRNFENPGSYHITMDQGAWVTSGDRQAAYTLSIKVKQGTAGSMHDFQRVIFTYQGSSHECSVYDAGKTCSA